MIKPETTIRAYAEMLAASPGWRLVEQDGLASGVVLIDHAQALIAVGPGSELWTLRQNAGAVLPPNRRRP